MTTKDFSFNVVIDCKTTGYQKYVNCNVKWRSICFFETALPFLIVLHFDFKRSEIFKIVSLLAPSSLCTSTLLKLLNICALTRVLLEIYFNVISHLIFYVPRGRDLVYADWIPNSTNLGNTLQFVSFAIVKI